MSYEAYEEELERLLDADDYAGAAQLRDTMLDVYENIDFYLLFEWPSYRMQGNVVVLQDYRMQGQAYLQGTTWSHDLHRGHLGNVFRLGQVAQDGE